MFSPWAPGLIYFDLNTGFHAKNFICSPEELFRTVKFCQQNDKLDFAMCFCFQYMRLRLSPARPPRQGTDCARIKSSQVKMSGLATTMYRGNETDKHKFYMSTSKTNKHRTSKRSFGQWLTRCLARFLTSFLARVLTTALGRENIIHVVCCTTPPKENTHQKRSTTASNSKTRTPIHPS